MALALNKNVRVTKRISAELDVRDKQKKLLEQTPSGKADNSRGGADNPSRGRDLI